MLDRFLYAEINLIGLFIVVIMCKKGKYSLKHQQSQRLFTNMLYILGIMLVLDSISWIINGLTFKGARLINILSADFFLCLTAVLGYAWIRYCDCVLIGGRGFSLRSKIYFIPALINLAVVMMSLNTGWAFYVDSSNIYHRGNIFIVHLIMILLYIVGSAGIIIYKLNNAPEAERGQRYSFLFSLIPPLAGFIIQSMFYGTSVLLIMCVLSVLMIFVNFQNDLIVLDQITGINNRLAFEKFTSNNTCGIKKNSIFFMIMIDVDNFKKINDLNGHLYGDKVLRIIGGVLKSVCDSGDMAARIGGDEFAVAGYRKSREEVDGVVDEINSRVSKCYIDKEGRKEEISVSMGYALFGVDGISGFDELLHKADENMYAVKRMKKIQDSE